jgi:putative membrane protein
MLLLLKWLIMTISIIVSSYLIPGVKVEGFFAALWVAFFLGIVNVLIKPILILITLPINILTLGLFTFVINALLILLASSVLKGFEVGGFWTAVLFGIVLSLINYVIGHLLGTKTK